MAVATVFIDDAVQGRLPGICAKTGEPTTKRLTIHQDLTGGLGAAWVLVFFGPPGWLVLALVAVSRRRRSITVRVPYGETMLDVYVSAARRVFHAGAVFGVVFVAIIGLGWGLDLWQPSTTFGLAMGTVVAAAVTVAGLQLYVRRWLVGVDLDASGRWVSLSRVHPDFAAACQAQGRSQAAAAPAPARW